MTLSLRSTPTRTTIFDAPRKNFSAAGTGDSASQPPVNNGYRSSIRTLGLLVSTLLLLLSLTAGLHAQAVAVAEVEGTVNDPSAKFIVGAQVTLTDADTKAAHATVTDGEGHYIVSNLPPGPYALEVKSPGFKDYRQSGIILDWDRIDPEEHIEAAIDASYGDPTLMRQHFLSMGEYLR